MLTAKPARDMCRYQQSSLANTLSSILAMKDKISLISNMAFEGIDEDGNNQIDKSELTGVLKDVAT